MYIHFILIWIESENYVTSYYMIYPNQKKNKPTNPETK